MIEPARDNSVHKCKLVNEDSFSYPWSLVVIGSIRQVLKVMTDEGGKDCEVEVEGKG